VAGLPGGDGGPVAGLGEHIVTVRRLLLVRHGQTDFNAGSRMQGQLDTELTDLGRAQAAAAAEVLSKRQPLSIVSSDLRRAYDTAVALAERSGVSVRADPRLRETHLGDWQGMTHAQVDAAAPGARSTWRDEATWAPPGGESRVDVAARGLPLIAELLAGEPEWGAPDEPDRPVVLVTHGGWIAALTAALLRLQVANWPALGGMGNASWTQLSGHGAADPDPDGVNWRLDVWNASAQVSGDVL
jgi:glucosyl-3-phosphoglycerate phosphatase